MLIALLLALVIAGVLLYASTRPDTLCVARRLRIAAPPERIQPLVADFHQWAAWSPYEKLDPAMRKTFSGAAAGVGAVYEWNGNNKAGAGRMEITGTTPELVAIKLDFFKPFEGHNQAGFSFVPQPDGTTEVSWTMTGPASFMLKLTQVFMDMDRMIGRDFEEGLANLRRMAEQAPH